jgi:hypothetical protein
MGIYLSYILYGDFSHTFCMGISLIHFVWDSTFFLLKSGPSSGTGKAPIAEGRALLEVEVLQYFEWDRSETIFGDFSSRPTQN